MKNELLEYYEEFGNQKTVSVAKEILQKKEKMEDDKFYKFLEGKIELYTNREENSNTDSQAQENADICYVYIKMIAILDKQKLK